MINCGVLPVRQPIRQKIEQRKRNTILTLQKELDRICRELIALNARKIILFGSLARGEASMSSDLDLIVILKSEKNFLDRTRWIYRTLKPETAADILVYTPGEFERIKNTSALVRRAQKEGKVLYEKES